MKLETAMISNEHLLQDPAINLSENEVNGIKLGIEALWEIQQHRLYPNYIISNPLPGETKE